MSFTNTDNPITNFSDDELGFESLAKRIANSIIGSNIDTTNSFTVSIEGKWGSGKTSLVNLIKNDIKDKVIVMEFNPWIVNDFEQLIKYFFSELTKELIYQSIWAEGAKKDDIIKDLKKLARTILPDNVRIGTKALSATYNKPKEKEETVLELKSKINGYLEKLDKKIVIIVDDIDRLTDKETETFFRLIKGIADFNNIIYLLMYDKAIVAKSLEQFKQENGERYLDKIVQYSFSIPKIYNTTLNNILDKKLKLLVKDIPQYNFNQDKWNTLLGVLNKKMTNIRDINKIVSAFSFEYPQIAEEVEFTDFFILSLIKIQRYELYEFIRDRKYVFEYSTHDKLLSKKDENKKEKFENKEKKFYSNLTNFISDFEDLFYILLPSIEDSKYHYTWHSYQVHTYKPLDNNHYFDNYFTFSVADNKFSTQEFEDLKNLLLSNNFNDFKDSILKINKLDKLSLFLEIFDENYQNKEFSKNIIINLLSIYQCLQEKESNLSFSSSAIKYFQYVKENFLKLKSTDDILEAIYLKKNNIRLRTKVEFYRELKKFNKYEINFDKKILKQVEKKLKKTINNIKIVDDYIKKESKDIELNISNLFSIVELLGLSSDKLVKEMNELLFKSKENFFNILNLFKSGVTSSNRGNFFIIRDEYLTEYFDITKIKEYMNGLDIKNFSEKEKEVFEAWKSRNEF